MDKNFETLMGGRDIEVTFLDGRTQVVLVAQLPIAELGRYLAVNDDEGKTIELFCRQADGWSRSLKPESFEAVLQAGEELNLDPLSRYAARQQARREKLMPGVTEKLLSRLVGTTSRSGAPDSPPRRD